MKKIKYSLMFVIPLVLFIIWTILVKTVDVHYISQIGFLGFYDLNTSINDKIQALNTSIFDKITDVLMILSFLTVIPFVVIGIVQLVKRKSLKAVDKIIYFMLIGYVFTVFNYFIFEIMKINFSPLSTPEELKASYPSSHLLSTISFFGIGLYGMFHFLKLNKALTIITIICVFALILVQTIFRLLSGQHYFTDIVGGVLLSYSCIGLVISLDFLFREKPEEVEEEKEEVENN